MMRTVLEVDTSTYPVYDSEDLTRFQHILEDMLDELRSLNGAPLPSKQEGVLKVRLAAGLFKAAEDGERDPAQLKQRALATLASPSRLRPKADH